MVNYLAVLIAALAAFVVGSLWYTVLFGKMWRKLMGISEGQAMPKQSMTQSMIGGFIATLVLSFVLAVLLQMLAVTTVSGAVHVALLVWLGFVATISSNSIWYEGRPWALYFINVAHYLVAIVVAALVLVCW